MENRLKVTHYPYKTLGVILPEVFGTIQSIRMDLQGYPSPVWTLIYEIVIYGSEDTFSEGQPSIGSIKRSFKADPSNSPFLDMCLEDALGIINIELA